MPRYYCDYCDTYLTHDSPSVRKQHNAGYKHKANVRAYYEQFEEQQTQSLIDQRIREHLQGPQGAGLPPHLMRRTPAGQSGSGQPPVLPLLGQPYPSLGPPLSRPLHMNTNGGALPVLPGPPPRPFMGGPPPQRSYGGEAPAGGFSRGPSGGGPPPQSYYSRN